MLLPLFRCICMAIDVSVEKKCKCNGGFLPYFSVDYATTIGEHKLIP